MRFPKHANGKPRVHRARIADDLDVGYEVKVVEVSGEDHAIEIARHLNALRRHLTSEQLREHVLMLAERTTSDGVGELSQREIADLAGVDQSHVNRTLNDPQVMTTHHLPPSRLGQDGKVYRAKRATPAPPSTTEPPPDRPPVSEHHDDTGTASQPGKARTHDNDGEEDSLTVGAMVPTHFVAPWLNLPDGWPGGRTGPPVGGLVVPRQAGGFRPTWWRSGRRAVPCATATPDPGLTAGADARSAPVPPPRRPGAWGFSRAGQRGKSPTGGPLMDLPGLLPLLLPLLLLLALLPPLLLHRFADLLFLHSPPFACLIAAFGLVL